MIKESHVSLEIAKLLKEKGFNEFCRAYWGGFNTRPLSLCGCNRSEAFDYCWNTMLEKDYSNSEQTYIAAPTLQMACRWLREEYNIHIQVGITICEDYKVSPPEYYVYISSTVDGKNLVDYKSGDNGVIENGLPRGFETHEEAVEASIVYCLTNLIK